MMGIRYLNKSQSLKKLRLMMMNLIVLHSQFIVYLLFTDVLMILFKEMNMK